jgi:hypothetical protein
VDDQRYTNRFTPRRPKSNWSNINVAKVKELVRTGRMQPAGLRAFEARDEKRTGVYSSEREKPAALSPAGEALFRRKPPATGGLRITGWSAPNARRPGRSGSRFSSRTARSVRE